MKVFRAASGSVFKLIRSDPTSLKKIIKNLLANYQTIKSQVPVSEKNKAIMEELESFNAVFELFDMQRKIEAGTFSIDSMNFKLLRKQLILAHPNQETFELLSIIYAEFNIFFLSIDYLDMARLIIMLQNDLITRMRKKFLETTFDDVEKDRASLTLGGKHSEIFYLEKLLVTSCRMMKKVSNILKDLVKFKCN